MTIRWGGKFRILNVMDDYYKWALGIEVNTFLSAKRVNRTLDYVIEQRSKPAKIRVYNGPGFPQKLWRY